MHPLPPQAAERVLLQRPFRLRRRVRLATLQSAQQVVPGEEVKRCPVAQLQGHRLTGAKLKVQRLATATWRDRSQGPRSEAVTTGEVAIVRLIDSRVYSDHPGETQRS